MTDLDTLRWFWLGRLASDMNEWAGPAWLFTESMPTPAGVDFPLASALAIARTARRITDGDTYDQILGDVERGTVSDGDMHSHAERVQGVAAALSRGTWPEGVPQDPRETELFFTEAWASARSSQVAPLVTRVELVNRWRVVDPRMLDYLGGLEPTPFETSVSLLDKILEMPDEDVAKTILTNVRWQVSQDPPHVAAIERFAQLPNHLEDVAGDMAYVMRLERKLERICEATLESAPDRHSGFADARQVVAEHRTSLVTLMESFTAHEVDLVRTALAGSQPAADPAHIAKPSQRSTEQVQVTEPREATPSPATPAAPVLNRDLDPITISVRLRQLWTDQLGPWLEETDNDLGTVWRDTLLRRVGLTLDVVSPINFGDGDPVIDTRGHIADLLSEATNGQVNRVRISFLGDVKYKPPRRAKTTDLDIFDPGDPDAAGRATFAAGIGDRVSRSLQPAARTVLSELRMSGASRHRVWLVAPDKEAANRVATTPGAAHALWDAVRRAQFVSKDPLFAIHSDHHTVGRLTANDGPLDRKDFPVLHAAIGQPIDPSRMSYPEGLQLHLSARSPSS